MARTSKAAAPAAGAARPGGKQVDTLRPSAAEVFVQQVEDLVVVVRRKDAQLAVHAPLQLFPLLLLLQHRQIDIEGRASADGALRPDAAPVGADDLVRQSKAEAGAFAGLFCGEEGSKMCCIVSLSMPQPVSVTLRQT